MKDQHLSHTILIYIVNQHYFNVVIVSKHHLSLNKHLKQHSWEQYSTPLSTKTLQFVCHLVSYLYTFRRQTNSDWSVMITCNHVICFATVKYILQYFNNTFIINCLSTGYSSVSSLTVWKMCCAMCSVLWKYWKLLDCRICEVSGEHNLKRFGTSI